MKRRIFSRNSFAVTMMYDAILFVVMVSMSGAVLIPALQSDIAVEGSIEKHREEIVDEALLMLMTSRADDFGYTLAGSQIESLTGIDVDYSGDDLSLVDTAVKTFLGREQKHKTYADICVENLICQLNVFGTRINIFTEDFDEELVEEITTILNEYLGEKYQFNFVIRWRPILGLEFGGDLEIGPTPPDTTHVAKSYVTLPNTYFSDWFKAVEDYIIDQVNSVTSWANDSDSLKMQIKNLTFNLIENITINGFLGYDSLIGKTVDYVFKPIEEGIGKIFGESAGMILEPLETVCPGVTEQLESFLIGSIGSLAGFDMVAADADGDGDVNISEGLDSLKGYVVDEVSGMLGSLFDGYIESFASFIVDTLDIITQLDEFKENLVDFFKEHLNVLRAEMVLTIWEARG